MSDYQHSPQLQEKKAGAASAWDAVWKSQKKWFDIVSIGRFFYNRMFLRELLPLLGPSTKMVELGCGTASLGRLISPYIKEYIGIDSSQIQVEKSIRDCAGFSNMKIQERDLYDESSHGTYDFVWSQGLLEHFKDGTDMIKKHLEYCKAGGTILISVPRSESLFEWWYRLTRYGIFRSLWPWTDQRFLNCDRIRAMMKGIPEADYRSFTVKNMKPEIAGIILLQISTLRSQQVHPSP